MAKKTYIKFHKSEKIADKHAQRIKKRGGKVTKEKTAKGIKLSYSF